MSDEEDVIGPLPSEAAPPVKKRKVLEFESLYLGNLPTSEMYEKSFMHRDVVTHVAITRTDFLITASCDGHIKFWKKQDEGIEFVKHFRAHLGSIQNLAVDAAGKYLASASTDKSLKVFDIVNFDMINMMKLDYVPGTCDWIHKEGDALIALAVSESETPMIHIYDAQGTNTPIKTLERLHVKPVSVIRYNPKHQIVASFDKQGLIEYWTGARTDFEFPKNLQFSSKLDTDLFELAKNKTYAISVCYSPNGQNMAVYGADRKIRIFRFLAGKLIRVIDESLSFYNEQQQSKHLIPSMEFSRRAAIERELDKTETLPLTRISYDESGNFLIVPTLIGIKVINLYNNTVARVIGRPENTRFLQVAVFQGKPKKSTAAVVTLEMEGADNPALEAQESDPSIFCTALKKNRFFIFTKREPMDVKTGAERDVFNEKPSKEDMVAATDAIGFQRIYDTATLHTSLGDVSFKLFGKECPKSVENFCVHAKNGYYNGHIFHRIIKQFMIQTGDPLGTGTGGDSIWGGEFEDEFHPSLRHDRPYTVSMANAGPNSNGSQFFITVIPTPWLDNKHTVFGRVTKGMEVVQAISQAKVHPKTDKPYEDIKILSVTVR